jgi:molybdate/tungstate transport system ATP-binding protein
MLTVKNINKLYKTFSLQNISFELEKGDYLTLLGPSGSGKTILLELIAGVQNPTSGDILLNKNSINYLSPEKRNIGLLYQSYMLFEHLTVEKNITFSLDIKKLPSKTIKQKLSEISSLLEITKLLKRYPRNLSGGEKQRVALARALIMNPNILLLDEPFTAIDTHLRSKVIQNIRKLHQDLNLTVIHVTHDIDEALYLANKLAIIHEGKLIQLGTKEEVFKNPKNKLVANFLGYKNIFKGSINNKNQFILNDLCIQLDSRPHINRETYILIPPESITISSNIAASSARNNFQGTITEVISKNGFYEIILDCKIQLSVYITHQSYSDMNLSKSKQVNISFKATSIKVF